VRLAASDSVQQSVSVCFKQQRFCHLHMAAGCHWLANPGSIVYIAFCLVALSVVGQWLGEGRSHIAACAGLRGPQLDAEGRDPEEQEYRLAPFVSTMHHA
jgi:hypothetical protein